MTPNTVLVIENESTTVTMVERSLQNEGYTMYSAVDADSGLQMALDTKPSLIFLNLAVQGANGLEICKTIHSNDALKDVPLILLTLREGKFDPIYTKLYGIVNFLKKPFTPEQLLENVREFAPFQAGAEAPAPAPTPSAEPSAIEEEPEVSFSYQDETEQEPSYEPVEEEPSYGSIDEPMEPAASFAEVDDSMQEMDEGVVDDDVYSLDENVSLEDAQAELESGESLAGGFSAEGFQQDMQMVPEDDTIPIDDENDLQTEGEDNFQTLGDAELSAPETGFGEMEEPSHSQEEESFDLPAEDVTPAPMPSAPAEDEIPDGPGLSLDGMGFDEPSEPIEPIEFEMPEEEEEKPAPKKRARATSPLKKGKAPKAQNVREPRKRPTSSINRPKSKRPLVLLLILIPVLLLAAGASYYFFLYNPVIPAPVAKAPVPKPVPDKPVADVQPADVQPAPVPPPQAPSAAQSDVPPPTGVTPAPASQPAAVPAPAVKPPTPTPAPTPKPAVAPKPAPPHVPAPTKATAPKPPPPHPSPPMQTAQEAGRVPAGAKYAVQFGVFSTEKNAQKLVDRLHRKRLKAYIRPRKASTGKFFYYVLLEGGFRTKDAAKVKAHQIKVSKGFEATVHAL